MRFPRPVFSIIILLLAGLACAAPGLPFAPTLAPTAAPSGTILFQDEFDSLLSGWDRVAADGGIMDYDSGVFRIVVNAPDYNFWSTPGRQFTDVRIEVDTARLNGPDENRAGIVCRVNGEQFYFFVISSDGYYAVGRVNGEQVTLLGQEQMQASDTIRTGLAINHLRADCIGSQLAFYVNGFPVAQAQDASLPSGDVGLVAGTFDQPGADIIFDKFIVMQP